MSRLQAPVLTDLLIDSARFYYEYLDHHGLGVEKIRMRSFAFEGQKLYIALGQKLFNTEGLLLRCKGRDYYVNDEDEIAFVSYDEQKQVLILEFLINPKDFKEFELLSDLKFLIKNVEKFFENHTLSLPHQSPLSFSIQEIPKERLSQEQMRAMEVIFSSPLSYIWGAPGSGKTQRVLFESLLWLIQRNQKIALIAPTNNALELALKTIIKKSDDLGLDRHLFLRLGVPSAEFLNLYPESCDGSVLQKKQLSLFNFGGAKDRIEQAKVIAMTLDGFIRKYQTLKVKFDHIFLDECGFAPLAKVCALCANPSPLTMLGDHKQLMPVCEIPKKEIQKYPQTQLWNQSGLFLEAFFKLGENMFAHASPVFEHTKTAILKQTYRYGDNLARILDHFIYQNGLRGREEKNEIYVIDCGGSNPPFEHTNFKEVEAIKKYHRSFGADYAVITPFVKQRQLLIQNGIHYERVFTIHGSQGQEFENVVFSPVTLHYHLTDSRNPLALQALNVAISRVKKRLIFVCDVNFWKSHPSQFLSVILKYANEWKVMDYGTH